MRDFEKTTAGVVCSVFTNLRLGSMKPVPISKIVQLKGRACVCVCVRAIGSLPCLVDDSVAHHRRRLSAVILDKAQNSTKCAVYKVKLFWPIKDRKDDSTPVGDDMTGSG